LAITPRPWWDIHCTRQWLPNNKSNKKEKIKANVYDYIGGPGIVIMPIPFSKFHFHLEDEFVQNIFLRLSRISAHIFIFIKRG
jgi:hypothetical protein